MSQYYLNVFLFKRQVSAYYLKQKTHVDNTLFSLPQVSNGGGGGILAGGRCQPLHDCVPEMFSHNNLHKTSFFIFLKKTRFFFLSSFSAYKEQILLSKFCSEQQGPGWTGLVVFFLSQMSEQS